MGTLLRQGPERGALLERRTRGDRRRGTMGRRGALAPTQEPPSFEPPGFEGPGVVERPSAQAVTTATPVAPAPAPRAVPSGPSRRERARFDRAARRVRPTATPDSYYGRPILKPSVWRAFIPSYFFTGGLAGASSGLALAAIAARRPQLARTASLIALGGLVASPPLLIADLGRPDRFYNMLRIVKPTSPMNVGTWVLTAAGGAVATAAAAELLPVPRKLRLAAHAGAALLGLPLSTYTAALLADTAVPAWHEGRRQLPLVFAGSSAAAAGGAAAALAPLDEAGPARILAIAGAALEVGAGLAMERGLGPLLAEPYRTGQGARLTRAARALSAAGAAALALGGRRRSISAAGGALIVAGSLVERFAVQAAGVASASDPRYVVEPQRGRLGRA